MIKKITITSEGDFDKITFSREKNSSYIDMEFNYHNGCRYIDKCTDDNLCYEDGIRQGREEVIDNINDNIHEIYKCQFYCMADMCEHDSPTVDMCIDCFYDAIQKSLEQLKEQNK